MKKLSKFLFVILAVALLFGLATTASAATVASGKCGSNLTWVLTDDGTLTITGTGAMTNFSSSSDVPWNSYRSDIKAVILPDGLTSIGNSAFSWCSKLTTITLPEGLTTIGDQAFYGCESLIKLTISKSVTTIGQYAFLACSNLTEFQVHAENDYFSSEDGVLFNKDKTTLIKYPTNKSDISYSIPEGVTVIGEYAISYSVYPKEITFPESLISIDAHGLMNCDGLTELVFHEGLTTIGYSAFADCDSLTKLTLPKSLKSVGAQVLDWAENFKNIYYNGNETAWKKISIGGDNGLFLGARLHFLNIPDYQLLSLVLKDSNGEELDTIPTGTFYAEATAKKDYDAEPVLIMLVTYTREGKMLQTTFLRAEVPSGSTYSQGCYINNTDGKVGEVKAFLLSSLGNPEPLSEAISVK